MSLEVEATFEKGILKPAQPVPLREGQKVVLTIRPAGNAVQRFCGSLPWTRDSEELDRFLNDPDKRSWQR